MEFRKKILIGLIFYATFSIFFIVFLNGVMVFDQNLFLAINSISNPLLDSIFFLITHLGSSVFWILMILFVWFEKKRKISLYLLIVFIIDSFSSFFIKWLFIRPRPYEIFSNVKFLNFDVDLGPSFPSGHTQRAFSGATIISSFYKKYRIPLFVLAVLVGVSRIYNGIHYPIDTIIGAINGILFGLIVLTLPIKGVQKKLKKI